MDLMQLLLSGAGGAIIGPLISQFLGGGNSSLITRIITGVVGGVGAGAGADAAGISEMLGGMLGNGDLMAMVAPVLEGGVGGGILSTLGGMVTKRND
ncbi:MAG: hypothetical protein AAFR29_01215 [Pseudomonadota bacterium]